MAAWCGLRRLGESGWRRPGRALSIAQWRARRIGFPVCFGMQFTRLKVVVACVAGFAVASAVREVRAGEAAGVPPVAELVADVRSVAAPGSPGMVMALSTSARPIVFGEMNGGALGPVVVAGPMGKGRVVAFGHSGYIDKGAMERGQTGLLMERMVAWAAGVDAVGGVRPRIRVGVFDGDLAAWLKERGFESEGVKSFEPATLGGFGVIVLGHRDLSDAQVRAVDSYIRGGGGVIAAHTGWGWQQIKARGGEPPDMRTNPLNVLLRDAGIAWSDQIVGEGADDSFDVTLKPTGPVTLAEALDVLLAEEAERAKTPAAAGSDAKQAQAQRRAVIRQASAIATSGVRLVPRDDETIRPRLRAMMDAHAGGLVPSERVPLKFDRPLARLLMSIQLDEIRSLPVDEVKAHAAAVTFPGAVPGADVAPRVSRTIVVNTKRPRWHSTGMYAAPGEVVTITMPTGGAGDGLSVRIGCHTDSLWHLAEWRRVPEVSRAWRLGAGATRVASAFGGLIYIDVPRAGKELVEVTISGAVLAPRYVLGKTTPEQWNATGGGTGAEATGRHAPAPWGEIETESVVISVPAAALRRLDDPKEIATLWQKILDEAADLRGISRERASAERFVPDVQISAGYMHSGYPIMTHLDVVDDLSLAATLRGGSWGLFHELGHNHQDSMWTFDGTVEVTCNLWSLYLMERISAKAVGVGHDAINDRSDRERRTAKHLGTGADFGRWKSDPFLALEMYIQLREAFGWEPFKKVFAEYDRLPREQRPRNEAEKMDQWMTRMSRAVERNLGPFFELWGVPTSAGAREGLKELPVWMPAGWGESR